MGGAGVGDYCCCGGEDGAEDESGVHCVGELGVGADGLGEIGELAFSLVEESLDGVLERGVLGGDVAVNDAGGISGIDRRRNVVRSTLRGNVKVDGGRHLPGVPEAGQRLYVLTGRQRIAYGRRASPVSGLQSRARAGIYQPFSAIHTSTGRSHRSRAPTRCSGAREAWCSVVKPSHLVVGE